MRIARIALGAAAALSVALISSRAFAQAAPTFQMGKADDVKGIKDVTWTAKGEAGLVETTGNSQTTSVSAGANVVRKDKDNKVEGSFTTTFARATTRVVVDTNGNGVIDPDELSKVTATSAENAAAKLRYDRYATELDSVYVAALAGFDKPAGKELVAGGQGGYSRSLFKTAAQQALAELGYDLSYVRLEAGSSTTIHSLRAFVGYKGKLTPETALDVSLEGLFNANRVTFGDRSAAAFSDTRLNGGINVTTSLSSKLSLSASFLAKFDNFPAPLGKIGDLPFAPGFEPIADKLDTTTKLSLIVTFL